MKYSTTIGSTSIYPELYEDLKYEIFSLYTKKKITCYTCSIHNNRNHHNECCKRALANASHHFLLSLKSIRVL